MLRCGHVAGGDQRLDRLEERDHAALVVDRAAAPDGLVLPHPGEGRVRPVLGDGGHHVDVRREQHTGQRGVAPLPGVEPAVARNALHLEALVQRGIALDEEVVQRVEGRPVEARTILVGDRLEAQHLREPRRRAVAVDADGRPLLHRELPRAECHGASEQHRRQQHHEQHRALQCAGEQATHFAFHP